MKYIVKGNLTKKPVLKSTTSGINYCIVTVAENHYKKTETGSFERTGTNYQLCAAYGEVAEQIVGLEKGQQVTVEGSMRTLPAVTRNGQQYPERNQIIIQKITAGYKAGERPAKAEPAA